MEFYSRYLRMLADIEETHRKMDDAYRKILNPQSARPQNMRKRLPVLMKSLKAYAKTTAEPLRSVVTEPITAKTKPLVTVDESLWTFYLPTSLNGWVVISYDTSKNETGHDRTECQFVYIARQYELPMADKIASFKKYGLGYAALERFMGLSHGVAYPSYTREDFKGMMGLVTGKLT